MPHARGPCSRPTATAPCNRPPDGPGRQGRAGRPGELPEDNCAAGTPWADPTQGRSQATAWRVPLPAAAADPRGRSYRAPNMGLTTDGGAATRAYAGGMTMSMTVPTSLSAAGLAQAIATRKLSAVEAVDAHIARIEQVNPELNAVVVSLFDDARIRARQADQIPAGERGPLHGVPVTVKECFDVAGTPSTAGLTARAGHRAHTDAPLVAGLRQAGAIILGKTNVSQLLMYVESDNPVYGRTNNPLDLERSPGGSSGGEGAIVAAGGSALGLGTDIGGSVRVPAHSCGIHSLKPTPGRLSVTGTVDIIGQAARTAIPDSGGLLARDVGDLRLALDVLSPPGGDA